MEEIGLDHLDFDGGDGGMKGVRAQMAGVEVSDCFVLRCGRGSRGRGAEVWKKGTYPAEG